LSLSNAANFSGFARPACRFVFFAMPYPCSLWCGSVTQRDPGYYNDSPMGGFVMQWMVRFLVGGIAVSLFATLGDVLKPKGFAGLFGAAPSIALATLGLTLYTEGNEFASMEARSMLAGAGAFVVYGIACVYLMAVRRVRAAYAAVGALSVWGLSVWGLWALFLR
jgi:uncharacterized membrane protein (GlpM family)